jgi:RecB family exonuclease
MGQSILPFGFVFSQSSLQDYNDCPRRFQLRYIDKLQWPAVEMEPALEHERRQQEGQLFHRLVQQHIIGIPVEQLTPQASSPNLHRWWENYCGHPITFTGYAQHTEFSLSAPLGANFRMLAKYDLVAIQPGGDILIYDWKTYAKRPRDERMAARWQTRVYLALLVQAGMHLNGGSSIQPEQVAMIYWYADHPTEPARFPYNATQFKRDQDALVKMTEEIAAASEFPKTDDEQKCSYCVYRSYCERNLTAGTGDFLETELAEPEINLEQIQEIVF